MESEIILSVLNLLLLSGNIMWQWSFRKRGTEIQTLQTLVEQNRAKDEIIKDLKREKDRYKQEYRVMQEEYKRLQNEVQKYRQQKGSI